MNFTQVTLCFLTTAEELTHFPTLCLSYVAPNPYLYIKQGKNHIHYFNMVSLWLCSQLREDYVTEKKALTQRGILVSEHITFL